MRWLSKNSVNVLAPMRQPAGFQVREYEGANGMRSSARPIDFDGVQIGSVRRQVEEPTSVITRGLCCLLVPVRGQLVRNDRGPGRDFFDENFPDAGRKGRAIHRALDEPGRNQRVLGLISRSAAEFPDCQ